MLTLFLCGSLFAQHAKDSLKPKKEKKEISLILPFFFRFDEQPATAGLLEKYTTRFSVGATLPEMPEYPYDAEGAFDFAPNRSHSLGLAVQYSFHQFSSITNNQITLALTYSIPVLKEKLMLRPAAGLSWYYFDKPSVFRYTVGDMLDPSFGYVYNTSDHQAFHLDTSEYSGLYPGAGIGLQHKEFFAGFSLMNITAMGLKGDSAECGNIPAYLPSPEVNFEGYFIYKLSQNLQFIPALDLKYRNKRLTPSPALYVQAYQNYFGGVTYRPYRSVYFSGAVYFLKHFMILASCGISLEGEYRKAFGISGASAGLRITF